MKSKSTHTALALLFSTFTVNAANIWDGGSTGPGDNNWGTAANWDNNLVPSFPVALTFAGSTRLTPNNEAAGRTVNGITFDAAAGAFTLGGNAITLGGNIGFSAAPAAPVTQTINMNLIMSSGRTFSSSSGGNGTLVVNGDISESVANSALTKGQLGTLFLNGDNSFTGALDIRAGSVSVNSIAATGSNSAIGAGSQISFGGPSGATANSTLTYTGTAAVTVNRAVLLSSSNANASGVIQNNSASGALTFTGTFTNSSTHITGTKNFTLGGSNAGANDFQSVISNSTGGGITSFTKSGDGVWLLSGTNTYTGATTVSGGKLVLSNNSAAGHAAGLVAVSGASATLEISSGITIANNVTVSNNTASVVRGVAANTGANTNDDYSVGTSGSLNSSFAGGQADTTARILAGTNSSGSAATLTMSFSGTSAATNDAIRRSDVFKVNGTTGTDAYVLQLAAAGLASDSVLGSLSGGIWDFAVAGNTGNNASVSQQNYMGSFAAFQVSFGTILGNYMGAYGYDSGGTSVWAVVNHGGDFTAVPEPTSALAGLLITAELLRRRRA